MSAALADAVLGWYAVAARDLPWRRPDAGPWAVLVSEVMLQQTPVVRVLPAYAAWLARWPTPAALAQEPAGEAIRQWGRLGYPRRALRLHAAAVEITRRHRGAVPSSLAELLALPGVGAYTARAVASFAFGQRHPVVDTNVRRVLSRVLAGEAGADRTVTAADRRLAAGVLPSRPAAAVPLSVALMELGALVCTARTPRCGSCPLAGSCAWRAAGRPAATAPVQRRPAYAGTTRQARGELLAALRGRADAVGSEELLALCADAERRERALLGLLADGLVERDAGGGLRLPGTGARED